MGATGVGGEVCTRLRVTGSARWPGGSDRNNPASPPLARRPTGARSGL